MSHKFQKSCSLKCEAKDATTNNDWTFSPAYIGIMPLQMLLLKESDPSKYSLTDKLMDHTEERKKDVTYWNAYQQNVVDRLKMKCQQTQFDPDEINRVCGVLDVNGYEIHTNGQNGFRGVYPLVSTYFSCMKTLNDSIN